MIYLIPPIALCCCSLLSVIIYLIIFGISTQNVKKEAFKQLTKRAIVLNEKNNWDKYNQHERRKADANKRRNY